MNQKANISNEVKASLVDYHLDKSGFSVFKTSETETVLSCLSLFEKEADDSPDVIIIDNLLDISYLVRLENKIEHFYLGFDIDYQFTSKGYLYVNKAKGKNYSMFSERSTVIFKNHISGKQFASIWQKN